jgi:hypothetical protein
VNFGPIRSENRERGMRHTEQRDRQDDDAQPVGCEQEAIDQQSAHRSETSKARAT